MSTVTKKLFDDKDIKEWLDSLTWKNDDGLCLSFSDESKESFKRELRLKVKLWLEEFIKEL
jgi:hypothetical protein